MPIGWDTNASRRHLPHLTKAEKTYFVTFSTIEREILPPKARDIALSCCVHDHGVKYWLTVAVVMPDHLHVIIKPYEESLSSILGDIKGASSHLINRALKRKGHLWQDESFDRIIRAKDDIRKRAIYICENPVRAGLVEKTDDWPWIWRDWIEGRK
jgi:putative transposase